MKIAAYGFADNQESKLGRILKLSRTHPYQLVDFDVTALPDLLLVFGEDPLQESPLAELPSGYRSRLIVVGKKKPCSAELSHISYPLISSRVLQALDNLTSANEEFYLESEVEDEAATEADQEQVFEEVVDLPSDDLQPQSDNVVSLDTAQTTQETSYRVLVVDDSLPMQKALAKELQSQFQHIEIDFADAGLPALDKVKESQYDFIFLDIMMPGIDGFETCTLMREIEHLKKTPIIMLSSKTSPLDEVKGIMAGSSTYLTKPIQSDEFQKVLGRICKWVDNFKSHP